MISYIFLVFAATVTYVNCQAGHPGFHATLTNGAALGANTTIRFDNALFNAEDAYDPSTGVFACPSPGLYFFHVALKSASLTIFGGSIVHGSTILTSANTKNDGLDMVSMAATVFCDAGESVYVMSIAGTPLADAPYCTFVGFKLLYGPITP